MANKQILPELSAGERYLCGVIDENGTITHTILLPGDADPAPWGKQMKWAKSLGGDLLNRHEQAIAFENMPEEFKKQAYWSNKESDSGWAWYQDFNYGYQYRDHEAYELRARAVRRLIIQ